MTTTLPPIDSIHNEVRNLSSGRRKLRFIQVAGIALFVLAVLLAVVAWFVPLQTFGWLALSGTALSLVIAAAAAAILPVDAIAVAKRYDDKVGTKDLLSSTLELEAGSSEPLGDAFVAAVREDAALATGKATSRDLYEVGLPKQTKWIGVPMLACLVPILVDLNKEEPPPPPPPPPAVAAGLIDAAQTLTNLFGDGDSSVSDIVAETVKRVKNLAEQLRQEGLQKRDGLAKVAKLASQLDKKKQELEARRMELEKSASKLAKGEDAKDAKQDMDAGRFREAANKIKKKLKELEEKLAKKQREKAGKLDIEKLKKRIAKLRELLAELEQLDALGRDLGFLVETLEALQRLEGDIGELGEFDGEMFEDAQLGRFQPPQPGQQPDGEKPTRLLVMPSSEAGEGHVKKVLGGAKRALSEREEQEARLREGKGKSTYGQVKTANDGSKSRTQFEEAFLAAKRAADDAIYRQNIPVGYRNYIRRYFEAMQPDDAAAAKKSGR